MYLLDTNICIPLINRKDPALAQRLLACDPGDVCLCSVVRAELVLGARNCNRLAENLDRVQRFCSAFASLPFDDKAAEPYGIVRAQLTREGRSIGANDLMIAAIALANNVTLVTRNMDEFRRVAGLQVEEW